MESDKMDASGLTREQIIEAFRLGPIHCGLQTFNKLCDLALRGLEIPVMAGPAGMQKAYDKGFADGQERVWKAARANTSACPDSISEPTEQPRPTETSPASALRQDSSGAKEDDHGR